MNASFFQTNRNKIADAAPGGYIILSAYTQMQRGNDAAFAFEQEANFWWLTAIEAPDWKVIIDSTEHHSWLVMPKVSGMHQLFDGSLSVEQAQSMSGIKDVITDEQAHVMLGDMAKKNSVVYTLSKNPQAGHYDFVVNPAPQILYRSLTHQFSDVRDCRLELAQLRSLKQPEEIEAIKKAIKLTHAAFVALKSKLADRHFEYEVEADFTYAFRHSGAQGHAYDPIVAAGKNACTLHYGNNQDPLVPGELLLLDIGARVDGYAADITRTYAYGEVSQRHKAVHAEVVAAHHHIVALLRPGLQVQDYSDQVDVIMQAALKNLNLLKTKADYRKYFPHAISHGLGIDVHDSLGSPAAFQPGMVLTVEPGIYIPEEGIGVRIEDDILITETGYENLSGDLPTSL